MGVRLDSAGRGLWSKDVAFPMPMFNIFFHCFFMLIKTFEFLYGSQVDGLGDDNVAVPLMLSDLKIG